MEHWPAVREAVENARFVCQVSTFRNWMMPDGSTNPNVDCGFKAELGR